MQNSWTPKAFNSLNSKTPNLLNLMHDLVKKSICHFVKKSFSSVSRYNFRSGLVSARTGARDRRVN